MEILHSTSTLENITLYTVHLHYKILHYTYKLENITSQSTHGQNKEGVSQLLKETGNKYNSIMN